MNRPHRVVLTALALALAAVLAAAAVAAPTHKHRARKSRGPTAVRTYRSGRVVPPPQSTSLLSTLSSLSEDEQEFVRLVNEERARRGLRKLTVDPVLVAAARQHSREMSELSYFDHYSSVRGLRTPLDRYGVALGRHDFTCTVGENLFYSASRNVQLGHRSLMRSPGHKANILANDYRAIGVGVYLAPTGEYYVTQMYHS